MGGEQSTVSPGVMREVTPALESSAVGEEYKTCAQQLQTPGPHQVSPYRLAA